MAMEQRKSMAEAASSSNSSSRTSVAEKEEVVEVSIEFSSSIQRMSSGYPKTAFSPHSQAPSAAQPTQMSKDRSRSPEQRLALVALRLAVLEKAATGLGKLAFVWATVVLLGGYVSNLDKTDFWIVSTLLLTEGSRVFSRSSELEWQQANYSLGIVHASSLLFDKSAKVLSGVINSHRRHEERLRPPAERELEVKTKKSIYQGFGARRTWSWSAVPFIPYVNFVSSRVISLLLYFLQLASAGVSIGFALWRLVHDEFNTSSQMSNSEASSQMSNSEASLKLFYVLILGEAGLFLVERAYWEYKLRFRKLLKEVNRKCQLGQENLNTMKQYYYCVYSRCLNGSVFDGLELDLVSFSAEKIQSSVREEQLGSTRILSVLALKGVSRDEARRKIGTTPGMVERLLEMITWKEPSDKEIRKAAAVILRSLAQQYSNGFRISAIPGSLESLASLLLQDPDEDKVDALCILKDLAKDHRTCVRMGNTSGVVSALVELIRLKTSDLKKKHTRKVFKKSLQLLKMMANTGGESGQSLRKKIASVVFSVRNLKEILEQEDAEVELQVMSLDILTSLANDDELREHIGATGGVVRQLVRLFTREAAEGSKELAVSIIAGGAISLLVLQSPRNCIRALNHKPYKEREETVSENLVKMISMLSKADICTQAATILRSLCKCLNEKEKREMVGTVPEVVRMVLVSSDKEQEAAVGLAAALVPMVDQKSLIKHRDELIAKTVELVSGPVPPPLIRKRRYSVELINALMERDKSFVKALREQSQVEVSLERMLETASDVENFYTFSGSVGLTRHSKSLEELVNRALVLLHS